MIRVLFWMTAFLIVQLTALGIALPWMMSPPPVRFTALAPVVAHFAAADWCNG